VNHFFCILAALFNYKLSSTTSSSKKTEVRNFVLPIAFLCVIIIGPGCLKSSDPCTPKTPASENAQMQAYCAGNGIIPTVHSSGLFYQIMNPGSGPSPAPTSKVFITYVGKLVDGTIFDQQSNASNTGWPLNQLIEGWRVGLPLIQKGGEIKLVVPSSMAYGCAGYGTIPGNAILFFDITLVDVQ
jgi:FKBP-type peptidyl-prolyl cis-trans isomerase FkpA